MFFASRGIEMLTVKGEKVRGAGINPMQVVDITAVDPDKFCSKSFELLNYQSSLSRDTIEDIRKLLGQIGIGNNFFKKFESCLEEFTFRLRGGTDEENNEYFSYLKSYGWLLFISAKKGIPELVEIFELIFLLGSVISYLFSGLDETTTHTLKSLGDKHQSRESLWGYAQSFLKIKDISGFNKVQDKFRDFLRKVLTPEVGNLEFGKLDRLVSLYKRLDLFYQKKYTFDEIDERLFMSNRKRNVSPKNYSPLKRYAVGSQAELRKAHAGFERKLEYEMDWQKSATPTSIPLQSKRILDYEKTVTFQKNANFAELVVHHLIVRS